MNSIGRSCRLVMCALLLNANATSCSIAEGHLGVVDASSPDAPDRHAFERAPATVLTMTKNGAWGAGTNLSVGAAIAVAVANCKQMHSSAIGCGANIVVNRGGWSLGIRCGGENIIVAEKTLAGAEQAAINREAELRRDHVPNMLPCVRVVTIDPSGAIIAPEVSDLIHMVLQSARREETFKPDAEASQAFDPHRNPR